MFTFDPSLGDAVSRIRLDLGDTTEPGLLEDETITATLAGSATEREATIKLASALIVRFSQEPDKVELEEGATVTWGARSRGWQALISRLQAEQVEATKAAGAGFRILRPSRGVERAEYATERRLDW